MDLPQEVIDYVVGFLHDDRSTLASCSLVSRQWQLANRYHLLSAVRVKPEDLATVSVEHFLGYIRLESSWPFAAGIRRLLISDDSLAWRKVNSLSAQELYDMLTCLPNLNSLELASIDFVDHQSQDALTHTYRFKID